MCEIHLNEDRTPGLPGDLISDSDSSGFGFGLQWRNDDPSYYQKSRVTNSIINPKYYAHCTLSVTKKYNLIYSSRELFYQNDNEIFNKRNEVCMDL